MACFKYAMHRLVLKISVLALVFIPQCAKYSLSKSITSFPCRPIQIFCTFSREFEKYPDHSGACGVFPSNLVDFTSVIIWKLADEDDWAG